MLGTPDEKIWAGYSELPHVKKFAFKKQPYNNLRKKFPAIPIGDQPYLTENGFDLLSRMLTYDPAKRITASEALKHPYFKEAPLPQHTSMMPTFPSNHEVSKKKRRLDEEVVHEKALRDMLLREAAHKPTQYR
eukprot:GEZU01024310.1.p1 GENE.GEZU01024310.1~~GEZU01024310.1.p1  ORF type:complete len:133 (+),score=37.37 GEZU01024310.1:220-618(+)